MGHEAENEEQNPGVLNLGEVRADDSADASPASSEPQTAPPRRRWIVPVVVFLVGALVGGYAWLARSDMLDSARVDLIATEVDHDAPHSDGTLTRVSAMVRNVGGEDLTITQARLPNQNAGDGSTDLSLAPGESGAVALPGELSCARPLPDAIDAEVRTPDGETSTRIPMPRTDLRHRLLCGSDSPDDVWLANPATNNRLGGFIRSGDGWHMTVPLWIRSWGAPDVDIVEVAITSSPGIEVEVSGLVGTHQTGTVADLNAELAITDCSTALQVEPIEVTATFADHPPDTVRVPDYYMINLVNVAISECGL